jgi:hypothetical protein
MKGSVMALFASGDFGFALFIFALLLWAVVKWVIDHKETIAEGVKDRVKKKAADVALRRVRKWFG